ncbi:antitoxin VbhA family protein [Arthrobacter sp. TMN-49]
MLTQKLSDAQVIERQAALVDIRHSTEMEGGRSSDQARALQDRWALGEISEEEMLQEIKNLYQL